MIPQEQWQKDFLFFYDWLRYTKSLGDDSYLDFLGFMKVCEDIGIKAPHRTNGKNIARNYFQASKDIDLDAFRNNFFKAEDIVVRRNKWSLHHKLI